MKRALLLLPGAFSGYGGIEMYNRQLVRAFLELGQERGFAVEALVLNDATEDVDDRYIPATAAAPLGFRRRRLAFAMAAVRRALRGQPDLVVLGHLNFARLEPFLRASARRTLYWYVVHGVEAWGPLPGSLTRRLSAADAVLSVSEYTKAILAKGAGLPVERVKLLANALDAVWQRQYEPRPEALARRPDGRPKLLTVARLAASERYKGVDAVIRALPELRKQFAGIRYEVVGGGDDRPRLEGLARELGVDDLVVFRGRLWPDELAEAYRDCTLYVMPSSHEGFGIVFLEAALFGKPAIGGRHGGTPEVIQDGVTGFLVDREDVGGLTSALERLLQSEDLRDRLGAAARERLRSRFEYSAFKRGLTRLLEGGGLLARQEPRVTSGTVADD